MRVKPANPRWQAAKAPPGCKILVPLAAGIGAAARDLCGNTAGAFTGSPAWSYGSYGPELGGFSSSNFVQGAAPAALGQPPVWQAVLCKAVASGTTQVACSLNSHPGGRTFQLYLSSGNAPSLYAEDATAHTININASAFSATVVNGAYHVLYGEILPGGVSRLFVDGAFAGTSTNAAIVMPFVWPLWTIGIQDYAGTLNSPYNAPVAFWAAGSGSLPDPAALARDWLSGAFSAIRTRPRNVSFAGFTALAQTVSPAGIASAEAFGTPTVTPGPVTISPPGIASAEAFGTATVSPGPVTVAPSGIASAEAFGTPTVSPGPVTIAPLGIPSAEAFGTPTVTGLQPVTLRRSLEAALKAVGAVAVVCPGAVYYQRVPEKKTVPAVLFHVETDEPTLSLDGPTGQSLAKVLIGCGSKTFADAEALCIGIQSAFDAMIGPVEGITVEGVKRLGEPDQYDEPADSTDRGTFWIVLTYQLLYSGG